jgi:hypothetical protein
MSNTSTLALLLCALLSGCGGNDRLLPDIHSRNPSLKIPAMKQAVDQRDVDDAGPMIKALESDDPAIRFYAIESLQRLTGQTLGYRYYEDRPRREPAVRRWKQWWAEQQAAPAAGARE